ncbi:hypothetical protein INS49_012046 [Diaporthe citri]|uniref:uncharacterized protein n=1 Tax=Diaporthe citri TaxID=83186 RepID=UPI001C7EF4F0|nr:uncharacterized protein INS49_012046 [Diaporthe citri]KAG6358529.1 hypothetical protein INS49_012046 [Diaporthe citri]
MSNTFRPMQEFEAKQTLCDILTNNRDNELFKEHIRRYVSSVMMTFIYGQRVPVPLWNQLAAKIAESRAPDCFVTKWQLTDKESSGIMDLEGAFTAGTMIEAGSESTSSASYSCIKYLAMSPQVQKRANEELSRVVVDQRSPSFDDHDELPHIRAIAKEIIRLRPIAPVSPPHHTTADVLGSN